MTLKGGVRNERLPFPAARFDAVVSRFGIEYGDLDLSAGEAARVMRPGARLRLILHHSGGVVLAHNRARHKALRWAAVDSGWFAKAVNLTKARALPGLPQLGGVEAAPAEAMARFPEQPVAGEFLTGLYQVLQVGSARPAEQVLAALDSLRGRAVDEIGRLEALAGAACDHARIERLRAAFDRAEVDAAPAQVISNASGGILAWTIGGTRR